MMRKEIAIGIAVVVVAAIAIAIVVTRPPAPPVVKEKYIHGLDAAYPPYTEVTPEGEIVGFDVDCVKWIAEKYGFEVEHKPVAWEGIITALVEGEIDFIASGMTHSPERAESVRFTVPYDEIYIMLMGPPGSPLTTRKEALDTGLRVGTQLGTDTYVELTKYKEKRGYDMEIFGYESYALAMMALEEGKVDVAAIDLGIWAALKKEPRWKDYKFIDRFGPTVYYAYAVRIEDQELLNMLNHGLRDLMHDRPLWEGLREKWGLPVI